MLSLCGTLWNSKIARKDLRRKHRKIVRSSVHHRNTRKYYYTSCIMRNVMQFWNVSGIETSNLAIRKCQIVQKGQEPSCSLNSICTSCKSDLCNTIVISDVSDVTSATTRATTIITLWVWLTTFLFL